MNLVVYFVALSVVFWLATELSNVSAGFLCGHTHGSMGFLCHIVGILPLSIGIIGSAMIALKVKSPVSLIVGLVPALQILVHIIVLGEGINEMHPQYTDHLYYYFASYSIPFLLVAGIVLNVLRVKEVNVPNRG